MSVEKIQNRVTHHVHGDFRCYDKDGNLKWEELNVPNLWHDEGELYVLSACFATGYTGYGAASATLYLGLDARVSLAEADTLATVSGEPSGSGYARQAIATNGTGEAGQPFVVSQPAAAYQVASSTETFTASGNWSAVTNVFLCTHETATTSGSGQRLLCSLALSGSRTVLSGDSLQASIVIGISE